MHLFGRPDVGQVEAWGAERPQEDIRVRPEDFPDDPDVTDPYYTTHVLERAIAQGWIPVVVSSREAFHLADGWWQKLVKEARGNFFCAGVPTSNMERNDDTHMRTARIWRKAFEWMGRSWPTEGELFPNARKELEGKLIATQGRLATARAAKDTNGVNESQALILGLHDRIAEWPQKSQKRAVWQDLEMWGDNLPGIKTPHSLT